ncbi:MAG: hypothetical protein ACREA4_05215 [Nitrososphaera sp.]
MLVLGHSLGRYIDSLNELAKREDAFVDIRTLAKIASYGRTIAKLSEMMIEEHESGHDNDD